MTLTEVRKSQRKPPTNNAPWALDKLPPFPMVATRLMQILAREDPDISEVGKMISAEPVFATRVLQMANSPLFALTAQVKTLSHAIVVLGLARVKSITVTRAVGDFVAPVLNVRSLRVCWQNSLAGALLAEKLARACKMDADIAYVAGLLRDIGRLALLVKYPDSYANLLAVSSEHAFDLMNTERELFDVDHCQAGSWLMARMPFPPELAEVVAHHHDVPNGGPFGLVNLIRIADRMADALGFAVVAHPDPLLFADVLGELPAEALARAQWDEQELKAEIATRIQTWG
ncbi:MAG TPA: HDOD domain-containing protein [Bryobacteraceae bacterium]|nr:HDOD domain-containing protein [Bryobacteraceae bacterium]